MCLIKDHWTVVPVAFDGGRITRDCNGIRCPHSVCFITHNIKEPRGIKDLHFSLTFDKILYYHYND